jgi:hypothetical protein
MQILQEQLAPLGVELNKEKARVVDMLKGDAFGSWGLTCVAAVSERGILHSDDSEEEGPQRALMKPRTSMSSNTFLIIRTIAYCWSGY